MCGYLIYQTEKKLKKSKVKKIEESLAHRGLGSSIHNEDGHLLFTICYQCVILCQEYINNH